MFEPVFIQEESFQNAWLSASKHLQQNGWNARNLVIQIKTPSLFRVDFNNDFTVFCEKNSIIKPKDVCYTIFPFGLYNGADTRNNLYNRYLNRFLPRIQRLVKKKKGRKDWGTYFQRMISYPINGSQINQLENIISAIISSKTVWSSAYTILIDRPGLKIKRMGAPCLNYIAIQLENNTPVQMGLLAVYRNHDFLRRAYGNYWGLCKLLMFLCKETEFAPGTITCISSHAYIDIIRSKFKSFLREL